MLTHVSMAQQWLHKVNFRLFCFFTFPQLLAYFDLKLHSVLGETAVTATVLGPVEVKLHNLSIEKAYVDINYRSKSGLPSAADKLREKIIKETCGNALLTVLYPRTAIIVQIFEMDDNGGVSILHTSWVM